MVGVACGKIDGYKGVKEAGEDKPALVGIDGHK